MTDDTTSRPFEAGFPAGQGLAVILDRQGRILEVINDSIGITPEVNMPPWTMVSEPGPLFTEFLDSGSTAKAHLFYEQIKRSGAAFNWELDVMVNGESLLLHFAGSLIQSGLIIFGTHSFDEMHHFHEELMAINNRQINILRNVLKERGTHREAPPQEQFAPESLDEMTKLNNELVNMQRELHKKNHELKHANNQLNLLLGTASHDLRNPLGVIMSYSEFLLESAAHALDRNHVEMLAAIRSSSAFMLSLIDGFLDSSRLKSGKLILDLKRTDPVALVRTNVELNRVQARGKNISIDFEHHGDLPEIMLDSSKIVQVVNNLLTNAIKYSPQDTTISLSLQRLDEHILLTVQDQGYGIPDEEAERVFQPYARSEKADEDGISTGLGLYIVRNIVTGHGGRIWFESDPDNGTVFFVQIPIVLPENLAPEDQARIKELKDRAFVSQAPDVEVRSIHTEDPLHILAAEDDNVNRTMIRRFLETAGHKIKCVENGEDLVKALHDNHFDIVLMDIQMPIMNGLEAARLIRNDPALKKNKDIPLIALTGRSLKSEHDDILSAGFNDILVKPFNRNSLIEAIHKYFADRTEQ